VLAKQYVETQNGLQFSTACYARFRRNRRVLRRVNQWRRQDLVPGRAHAKVTGFLQEAVRLCVGQSALKKL